MVDFRDRPLRRPALILRPRSARACVPVRRAVEFACALAIGYALRALLTAPEPQDDAAAVEACGRAEQMAEAALAAQVLALTDLDAIKAGCWWTPGGRLEVTRMPRKRR